MKQAALYRKLLRKTRIMASQIDHCLVVERPDVALIHLTGFKNVVKSMHVLTTSGSTLADRPSVKCREQKMERTKE